MIWVIIYSTIALAYWPLGTICFKCFVFAFMYLKIFITSFFLVLYGFKFSSERNWVEKMYFPNCPEGILAKKKVPFSHQLVFKVCLLKCDYGT